MSKKSKASNKTHARRSGPADGSLSERPTLSVIVPIYNRTDYLKKCLAALSASQYEAFDVLVVDDGSSEPVQPIVAAHGFDYMRLEGPGGPARARNHGAANVGGQYLVFIDADVCVQPDTLARFAAAFAADPGIDAVVGAYDDAPSEANFISQYKNLFHHYIHRHSDGEIPTFWSGCGAIRRDLFMTFGGFDAMRYHRPAIEDIELGAWLTAAGYRVVLDSRIRGKHLKRWTLRSLLKADIFDRGIPWTRLMWRVGAMDNTLNITYTQRLSVALVYLLVVAAALSIRWPILWLVTALLALSLSVINLDVYRFFARRAGLWFSLRTIPLHWLYFGYCGFCFICGSVLHLIERTPGKSSDTSRADTDLERRNTAPVHPEQR